MDALSRLAGDLSALATAWEREPLVSTGLGDFTDVFSVDLAQRLIHSGLPLAAVRLFQQGTRLPTEAVARAGVRRGREPSADGDLVTRQVRQGATLVLEDLHTYCPEVAAFADAITDESGYNTYCAAFLTPGGSRGVAPHYDTASVFLRQVMGSKRWRVSAPVQRWPSREWTATTPVDTEPVLDVVLKEGDCLYLPRGYVHVGDATQEASAHLSIGLPPVTWGAFIGTHLSSLMDSDEAFREALPPRFASADLPGMFAARLDRLAQRLTDVKPRPPTVPKRQTRQALADALTGRGDSPDDER